MEFLSKFMKGISVSWIYKFKIIILGNVLYTIRLINVFSPTFLRKLIVFHSAILKLTGLKSTRSSLSFCQNLQQLRKITECGKCVNKAIKADKNNIKRVMYFSSMMLPSCPHELSKIAFN